MPLSATVYCGLAFDYQGAAGAAVRRATMTAAKPHEFMNGTTAGKADVAWAGDFTTAASTVESIDLRGTLTSLIGGGNFNAVKIKALFVEAAAGNAADIIVGGASSNTWQGPFNAAAHKVRVEPGGRVMILAPGTGWAVTAGTGDILAIENASGAASATYKVGVIATSA